MILYSRMVNVLLYCDVGVGTVCVRMSVWRLPLGLLLAKAFTLALYIPMYI